MFNSQALNTNKVYGKIYLCGIKYSKHAEIFKRSWHIVQDGMAVILGDKTTRLPMQSFEFGLGPVPFLTGNVQIYRPLLQYFIKNQTSMARKIVGKTFQGFSTHGP